MAANTAEAEREREMLAWAERLEEAEPGRQAGDGDNSAPLAAAKRPGGLSSSAVADHARPPEPGRSEIEAELHPSTTSTRMPTNWRAAHAGQ
jgi:hypothetical protein